VFAFLSFERICLLSEIPLRIQPACISIHLQEDGSVSDFYVSFPYRQRLFCKTSLLCQCLLMQKRPKSVPGRYVYMWINF